MTATLVAASVVVIVGLVAVLAAFLWVIGSSVERMATVLGKQVAPGAAAVAGHVAAMSPAIDRLGAAISDL
ncbi:MAG: hypothetical protein ABR511_02930 [Acidimicrobiales bacterium]